MKKIIIALIFILVCVSAVLIGCAKKDESMVSPPGFTQETLAGKRQIIEGETSFTEFKNELESFKSFSEEFFPIWVDNKNILYHMIDDFNNCNTLKEKVNISKELEQKYSEFKFSL